MIAGSNGCGGSIWSFGHSKPSGDLRSYYLVFYAFAWFELCIWQNWSGKKKFLFASFKDIFGCYWSSW